MSHEYTYIFILLMGTAALFGLLGDLIRRKNITNRFDAVLSVIQVMSYFLIITLTITSKWMTPLPYILSVIGYAFITFIIYYYRKQEKNKNNSLDKENN